MLKRGQVSRSFAFIQTSSLCEIIVNLYMLDSCYRDTKSWCWRALSVSSLNRTKIRKALILLSSGNNFLFLMKTDLYLIPKKSVFLLLFFVCLRNKTIKAKRLTFKVVFEQKPVFWPTVTQSKCINNFFSAYKATQK